MNNNVGGNYPNPFNPSTIIRFNIPGFQKESFGNVTLKVYDVSGKLVQTLVNDNLSAGSYEVTFDGSKLVSGVYFYRIAAGDFS